MLKTESDTSLNQPSFVVNSYRNFSTVSDNIAHVADYSVVRQTQPCTLRGMENEL